MGKQKSMKTYISDTFPLDKLECQYFDICKVYDSKICGYSIRCKLRQCFRFCLEDFVAQENMKFQIGLILDEYRKEP